MFLSPIVFDFVCQHFGSGSLFFSICLVMLGFTLIFCSRKKVELLSLPHTSGALFCPMHQRQIFQTVVDDDSKHSTTAPSLLAESDRVHFDRITNRTSARATGCCSNYVRKESKIDSVGKE